MVVPMSATPSRRKALEAMKCGHDGLVGHLAQSGWPSIAAIGYVTKTSDEQQEDPLGVAVGAEERPGPRWPPRRSGTEM